LWIEVSLASRFFNEAGRFQQVDRADHADPVLFPTGKSRWIRWFWRPSIGGNSVHRAGDFFALIPLFICINAIRQPALFCVIPAEPSC
jgi:hypothetical protein